MIVNNKKLAIIDLGTNTFHLLVAEIRNGSPTILFKDTTAVKIGQGGISKSFISPEAQQRGILALQEFRKHIDEFKVDDELVFATSAFRTAGNSNDFLNKISRETGFKPTIIDGSQEAKFIFQGVCSGLVLSEDPALIMDIGGGSVEFIMVKNKEVSWFNSYEIGAQRLMDQFHRADPIREEQLLDLEFHLDQELASLKDIVKEIKPATLIGVAGTFDSLSEIFALRNNSDLNLQNSKNRIPITIFHEIYLELAKKTYRERLETPGLIAFRAGMIVVAFALVHWVLKQNQFMEILVSKYSLKEGVLYSIINNKL